MRRFRTLQLIVFALLVLGAISAFVYWIGNQERAELVAEYHERLLDNAQERAHIIDRYVDNLVTQVRFLALVPPIQGIVRAQTNQGFDALDNSTQAQWESRLQQLFVGLISNHPELTQLRLIGVSGNGKEIVRADRINGQAVVTPVEQLQEKGQHDYVKETLKRAAGQVYVSHINLNREHGKVALPHVPTVRVATPIANVNGGHLGLLVINSNVAVLLESLVQYLPPDVELFLTNDKAEFIIHPQAEKTFGFDLGQPLHWQDEFSKIPDEDGVFTYRHERWHVISTPITLDRARDAKPYTLALALPDSVIAKQVVSRRFEILLASSAGVLLPLIFALQFMRNLRLQQFSQNMSAIVDAAPYALVLVNDRGKIENVNATTEKLFGYPRENLIGQRIEVLVPEPLRDSHVALRDRFLQAPSHYFLGQRAKLKGQNASGATFPIEIGLNYINTDTGIKVLAGVVDLSERKAAEAERDRLVSILERTSDFIGMADMQGNLKFHNRAALQMVGIPPDTDLSHMHISDMHPPWASQRVLNEGIPAVLEHGIWQGENALLHRDGHEIPVSQVLMLHRDAAGEPQYLSTVMRDASGQKQREHELIQARHDAEAANRAKSTFVANMSHEIRTPLNAVIGMLQLLKRTIQSGEQKDYVEKAELGAQSLLAVLNDILDFSKMEAGKIALETQPFHLDEVFKKIGVVLFASVGPKNVEVLFDIEDDLPATLVGDALRLQQVLLNLAGNAIKFTDNGEVVITVRSLKRDANQIILRFEVTDTGIGIAPEHWEKIFEGFTQADSSINRRFGGTGLGLAITRHLVQLMGGTLGGHSVPNQGTTFYFDLNFGFDSTASDNVNHAALTDLRVLVVEDNPRTCAVLARMLSLLGWHPRVAHNKGEALQQVENAIRIGTPFDAVFIDWNLPRMDGFKTGRRLRELPAQPKPLVIIMMTHHEGEHPSLLDKKEVAEVDGLVSKPVTASALYDAVLEVYRQRSWITQSVDTLAPPAALLGVRVLLVEDNSINQQVARDLLKHEGAQVTVADNGQVAVTLLQNNPTAFDIVLMDLQMPVMNGFDATEYIRIRLGLLQLPIIAMTANAMQEDRLAALAKGMNDHVGKPFDIRQLCAIICQHVRVPGGAASSYSKPAAPDENERLTLESQPAFAKLPGATMPRVMPLTPQPLTPTAAPVAPEMAMLEVSVVDVDSALARFGNDKGILHQALIRWPDEWQRLQATLDQALSEQSRELLVSALHSIKGISATLGATVFSRWIASLEAVIKSGAPPEEWRMLLQPLPAAGSRLLVAMEQQAIRLGQESASVNAGIATQVSQEALALLSQRLKNANMDALTQVDAWANVDELPSDLAALKAAVLNLDFSQAQALCETLLVKSQTGKSPA